MLIGVLIILLVIGVVFALVPNMDSRIKTAVLVVAALVIVLAVLGFFGLIPTYRGAGLFW